MVAVFVATNLVDGVCQRKPNQESLGELSLNQPGIGLRVLCVKPTGNASTQWANARPSRLACQRQLPLVNEPSGELNMDGQDGQGVFLVRE